MNSPPFLEVLSVYHLYVLRKHTNLEFLSLPGKLYLLSLWRDPLSLIMLLIIMYIMREKEGYQAQYTHIRMCIYICVHVCILNVVCIRVCVYEGIAAYLWLVFTWFFSSFYLKSFFKPFCILNPLQRFKKMESVIFLLWPENLVHLYFV